MATRSRGSSSCAWTVRSPFIRRSLSDALPAGETRPHQRQMGGEGGPAPPPLLPHHRRRTCGARRSTDGVASIRRRPKSSRAHPRSLKRAMSDERLTRWRSEVRRVIPVADDDLVEEVAQHVAIAGLRCARQGTTLRNVTPAPCARLPIGGRFRCRSVRRGLLPLGCGRDGRTTSATRLAAAPPPDVQRRCNAADGHCRRRVCCGVRDRLRRPLASAAVPDADRLVVLWQVRQGEQGQVSYPDFADVAAASVFDRAAAMGGGRGSLRVGESIERVNMIHLEPQGYSMLGARPVGGRRSPATAEIPTC